MCFNAVGMTVCPPVNEDEVEVKPPSKKEVPQEWVTLRPGLLTGWTLSTNQLESRTKSHTYSWGLLSYFGVWQKGTGNTDTIFLSNALPVTVTGSIWQEVSVCVRARAKPQRVTPWNLKKWNMNPKDIVYKMVVLGRRLTTHFILDIFWGSCFMVSLTLKSRFLFYRFVWSRAL